MATINKKPAASKASDLPPENDKNYINEMNVSAGGVSKGNYKPIKTDGIRVRGTGAATKALIARGPMA
jgi:hypothetical protein